MGWGGEMWRVWLDLSLMRYWDHDWFSVYHHKTEGLVNLQFTKGPDALSVRSGKSRALFMGRRVLGIQ